jgi:hypothetical protein
MLENLARRNEPDTAIVNQHKNGTKSPRELSNTPGNTQTSKSANVGGGGGANTSKSKVRQRAISLTSRPAISATALAVEHKARGKRAQKRRLRQRKRKPDWSLDNRPLFPQLLVPKLPDNSQVCLRYVCSETVLTPHMRMPVRDLFSSPQPSSMARPMQPRIDAMGQIRTPTVKYCAGCRHTCRRLVCLCQLTSPRQ